MSIPFKVGDKIVILRSHHTGKELWDEVGEVVAVDHIQQEIKVVLPNHTYSAYTKTHEWRFCINLLERVALVNDTNPASVLSNKEQQEKLCKVCSKPNDLGVSSCWMCGNAPF
jgi:hypothetical protein